MFFVGLLLVAVLLSHESSQGGESQVEPPAPLGTGIPLFHAVDYQQCETRLMRAQQNRATSVAIFPSLHYILLKPNGVQKYCLLDGYGNCNFSAAQIKKLIEESLTRCFSKAVALGIGIEIAPHLDSALSDGHWRNNLVFDPLQKIDGQSYYDLLINPIENALMKSGASDRLTKIPVNFTLGAEMGASVFRFSLSYLGLLQFLKGRFPDRRFRWGIAFNHAGVTGSPMGAPRFVADKSLKTLISSLDFVGFSNYLPIERLGSRHFKNSVDHFIREFEELGVYGIGTKEIHFTEIGLGGRSKSSSRQAILEAPYGGVTGGGEHGGYNPWARKEYSDIRIRYYQALLEYLNSPVPYKVTRAYNWGSGSWDFQGLTDISLPYADRVIQGLVSTHNAKILKRK